LVIGPLVARVNNGVPDFPYETNRKRIFEVAFLALLEAKRAVVLDHSKHRMQAAALERRIVGGNEIIDHPASTHDDVVNAVAGVLTYATRALRVQKIPMVAIPDLSKSAVVYNTPNTSNVPEHYLARRDEPWRRFVNADGLISPRAAGGGKYWGPV
jgi:hypothetical protein